METREFILGTRQQQEWRWLVTVVLFFTGIGAGLFILALIPGFVLGMAVGAILVLAVSLSLQEDLSRRRAVLHLFARPQSSWMSRGTFGIIWRRC